VDIGAFQFDPDKPYVRYTVKDSAGPGGTITPEGNTSVWEGSSLSYTIKSDPTYALTALIVDGISVGTPSSYTLSNLKSDHTITAVFAHDIDYFGIQAGNHLEFLVSYTNGRTDMLTDDITLDSQSSSLLDKGVLGGNQILTWYQVASNSLLMGRQEENGTTLVYTPPPSVIETPLAANNHWTASFKTSEYGVSLNATLTAKVSPQELVHVPAGYFMAWPIAYTFKASARGRSSSATSKTWFSPYIGTVKDKESKYTATLTAFSVGAE